MGKFNLKLGDVISISISENLFGFAQIVSSYDKKSGGFLIAVFNYKSNTLDEIQLSDICNSDIVFIGFTFDAKIYHKQWIVIGNYTHNVNSVQRPLYFKLGTPPDEFYLVDENGKRLLKISEETFNKLSYKSEIAPIRYENALKAYLGLEEWKVDYDEILYMQTLKLNKLAIDILNGAETSS